MKSHTRLLTVLDRMDNGPVMDEKDFDKLIAKTVRKLIKKYDLQYDRDDAILTSDEMADRFFAAGLELACTAGVYCTDTHVSTGSSSISTPRTNPMIFRIIVM